MKTQKDFTDELIKAGIKSAMGYLFGGGEFPEWLSNQEVPMGAIKEYEEAKEWFDKNKRQN